jgi:hypothetical protein
VYYLINECSASSGSRRPRFFLDFLCWNLGHGQTYLCLLLRSHGVSCTRLNFLFRVLFCFEGGPVLSGCPGVKLYYKNFRIIMKKLWLCIIRFYLWFSKVFLSENHIPYQPLSPSILIMISVPPFLLKNLLNLEVAFVN